MINDEKLIYSIIREIQNDHKIFDDETNKLSTLKYNMFVDDKYIFVFNQVLNEIHGRYIERKELGNEYFKYHASDITTEGYEFRKEHSYWNKEYPGLTGNIKEWIEE